MGCFVSLDKQSCAGMRDSAIIHGGLAAAAFLIAWVLKPEYVLADDFLFVAGIGALIAAKAVIFWLRRLADALRDEGALQGDLVTLGTAAWIGAALASGSAKAVVFVLLVGALAAALKARPAEVGAVAQAARSASRQVVLRNSVAHLVDKLNRVSVEIRTEAEERMEGLRILSARMLDAERRSSGSIGAPRQRGRDGYDPRGASRNQHRAGRDRRPLVAVRA